MRKYIIPIILASSLLSGCFGTFGNRNRDPAPDTVTAKIPVVMYPSAPKYTPPNLVYLERISKDTSDSDTIKYYYLTIEQLKGEVLKLDLLLSGYRCDTPDSENMCISRKIK